LDSNSSPSKRRKKLSFFLKKKNNNNNRYDLSSLRVLGSVGEPINPSAWHWYNDNIGKGRCAIVDTFWQTETGGHVITALPGATPTKPGCATLPFFGIQVAVLDPVSGQVLPAVETGVATGLLVITRPWPSIGRTIQGDHARYLTTYMSYKVYNNCI
jgi:acetyl-CoA synthetase